MPNVIEAQIPREEDQHRSFLDGLLRVTSVVMDRLEAVVTPSRPHRVLRQVGVVAAGGAFLAANALGVWGALDKFQNPHEVTQISQQGDRVSIGQEPAHNLRDLILMEAGVAVDISAAAVLTQPRSHDSE